MDIKNFVKTVVRINDQVSVLIRGDHGIGKSQIVKQLGAQFNLPIIDKRLSQLTEGDIIGLPKLESQPVKA